MVGKKKRKKRDSQLLGSHQKCWLWGRHAVMESLKGGAWLPLEVVCDFTLLAPELATQLEDLAASHEIPLTEMPAADLKRLCGSGEHQGLMARMPPYPYADAETVLKRVHARSALLVLAGIQDPFNFGSILRSADQFGFDAVIVPSAGQAAVSSHVARSSVGAVNYLQIAEVDDLEEMCRNLIHRGVQICAATEKGNLNPAQARLDRATAIIIGNEATGISEQLLHLCDTQLCIPLQGHVDSLNAAVAAGILCYELRRQRQTAGV